MSTMITSCFLSLYTIHADAFKPIYIPYKIFSDIVIITATIRVLLKFHHYYHGDCRILADGTCKYTIWNAAIASLQFWAEELNPITLSIASEHMSTPPSSGHLPVTHYASTI